MKRYEQVPHTADLAAEIYGETLEELFENAAFAMSDMAADLGGLAGGERVTVEASGPDEEGLLIAWLNEVLYVSFHKKMIFYDFKINALTENKLSAEAFGVALSGEKSRVKKEIKAATHHDVRIEKNSGRYEVTVVFDV